MITEQDKENTELKLWQDKVRFCEETIAKAEKYERLKDNPDWQAHIADWKILIDQHDKEILMAASMLPDAPSHPYVKQDESGRQKVISSREDWMHHIMLHEIRRDQLKGLMKETELILLGASLARERLPGYKKQLAELTQDANPGNGKS